MRLFVAVGNGAEPFDRLLAMVDAALSTAPEPVEGLCQRGPAATEPRGLVSVRAMVRSDFDREIEGADVVVCHGGVGTLATALRSGHRPIVLARRVTYREVVNDHQLEVVAQLVESGDVFDAERGIDWPMLRQARQAKRPRRDEKDSNELVALGVAISGSLVPPPGGRELGGWRRRALATLAGLGPRAKVVTP